MEKKKLYELALKAAIFSYFVVKSSNFFNRLHVFTKFSQKLAVNFLSCGYQNAQLILDLDSRTKIFSKNIVNNTIPANIFFYEDNIIHFV